MKIHIEGINYDLIHIEDCIGHLSFLTNIVVEKNQFTNKNYIHSFDVDIKTPEELVELVKAITLYTDKYSLNVEGGLLLHTIGNDVFGTIYDDCME